MVFVLLLMVPSSHVGQALLRAIAAKRRLAVILRPFCCEQYRL
jgi:hypothetical protein